MASRKTVLMRGVKGKNDRVKRGHVHTPESSGLQKLKTKEANCNKKWGNRKHTRQQCKRVTHEMIRGEYTGVVGWTFSPPARRHTVASVEENLGAGAGARDWAAWTWRPSAATRGVAAWPALASASTAATRARATVAGAARTFRLHANVGRLSLKHKRKTHIT